MMIRKIASNNQFNFGLTGNFDECVRSETDELICCSLLVAVPGMVASPYDPFWAGCGGILYGG